MTTEINIKGRQALSKALAQFHPGTEVWRDEQGVYWVGDDVENNDNYPGCVYQGTVAEVREELED
jgi:hypothetical protein